MKHVYFIFIIIVFGLLQATLLEGFRVFNVKPDLLLCCVVFSALFIENKFAIFYSIVCGLLKDILGVNSLGLNTLLFPLWGLAIMKLSKKISFDNSLIQVLAVFVVSFINDIVSRLMLLFLGYPIGLGIYFRISFLGSLYTAAVLPLVSKVAKPFFLRS